LVAHRAAGTRYAARAFSRGCRLHPRRFRHAAGGAVGPQHLQGLDGDGEAEDWSKGQSPLCAGPPGAYGPFVWSGTGRPAASSGAGRNIGPTTLTFLFSRSAVVLSSFEGTDNLAGASVTSGSLPGCAFKGSA